MSAPAVAGLLPAHLSARGALGRKTLIYIGVIVVVTVGLCVAFPHQVLPVLTGLIALAYVASTVDRNYLMISGITNPSLVKISDAEALAIPDDELPYYTVLLPVYDEPSIVTNLINGVGRIDYPAERLELLLLVEEDDPATQEALIGAPMQGVRVVIVPDSQPKTKPKACNYGMALPDLRGEYMTIYDAEDIPDPLQLRRAVVAFQRAPENIGCLQGRLGYFNERQNLLTRWFTLEYDQWFGVVLPSIERLKSVVPLGGTLEILPNDTLGRITAENLKAQNDLAYDAAEEAFAVRLRETFGDACRLEGSLRDRAGVGGGAVCERIWRLASRRDGRCRPLCRRN